MLKFFIMRDLKLLLVLLLGVLLCSGCWFKKGDQPEIKPEPKLVYLNSGSIKDQHLFSTGKNILVIPFTAGSNVPADEQTDRVALNVIKGIADILEKNDSSYQVVTVDSGKEADFIIRGHITELGASGKIKKWVLFNNEVSVGVSAEMKDRASDAPVAVFSYRKEGKPGKSDYSQLGYEIGEDIGMFFLKQGASE